MNIIAQRIRATCSHKVRLHTSYLTMISMLALSAAPCGSYAQELSATPAPSQQVDVAEIYFDYSRPMDSVIVTSNLWVESVRLSGGYVSAENSWSSSAAVPSRKGRILIKFAEDAMRSDLALAISLTASSDCKMPVYLTDTSGELLMPALFPDIIQSLAEENTDLLVLPLKQRTDVSGMMIFHEQGDVEVHALALQSIVMADQFDIEAYQLIHSLLEKHRLSQAGDSEEGVRTPDQQDLKEKERKYLEISKQFRVSEFPLSLKEGHMVFIGGKKDDNKMDTIGGMQFGPEDKYLYIWPEPYNNQMCLSGSSESTILWPDYGYHYRKVNNPEIVIGKWIRLFNGSGPEKGQSLYIYIQK